MRILADASLPELKIAFPAPFKMSTYHDDASLKRALNQHNILLCRSTLMVDVNLLQHHILDYLLTASSGRDHIHEADLGQTTIFDAKGANASAVADYVLSSFAYLKQHHHFEPKTIGIIGFGYVGKRVYAAFQRMGYQSLVFDPIEKPGKTTLNDIAKCDLVCIHANLHKPEPYPSYHLIDAAFLKQRTAQQAIINAARGDIVDEDALLKYHQGLYCTDVYSHEPNVHLAVLKHAVLCTPHIAGHTIEARSDIVRLLSQKLHEAYHLPAPTFPPHPRFPAAIHLNWERTVLAHYNPLPETQALKSGVPFVTLRKQHIRHGFD